MTPLAAESEPSLRIVLGSNVRRLRQKKGWSQEKLAEAAGTSLVYVSLVETAKNAATVDIIEKLARGLGVPAPELLKD